jgi:hypothetical protein
MAAVAALSLAGWTTARADQFSDTVTKANSTLTEIDRLLDGIKARNEAGGGTVATAMTMKCPACGMEMPSTPKAGFRAVKFGGKTFYCCKGCDMSKFADK